MLCSLQSEEREGFLQKIVDSFLIKHLWRGDRNKPPFTCAYQPPVIQMIIFNSVINCKCLRLQWFFPQNHHLLSTMCKMCRTTVCDKTRFVDFQSFLQVISSVISPGQTVIASCSLIICYFTNLFLAANFAGKFHWLIPTITSPPLTPCPCKITLGHWLTPDVPREEYPEYFPFKTWIFNFLCSVFNT